MMCGTLKGKGLEQAWFFNLAFYEGTRWQVANEIMKPQVSINSNNLSIDCSPHCKKIATGNGNLQPEIEINEYSSEYSSSKKLLE